MGHDAAVAEADHGMDDRFGVDHHLDLRAGSIPKNSCVSITSNALLNIEALNRW
jgi:hypothetical protein